MLNALLLASALDTMGKAPVTARLDNLGNLGVVSTMIDGKGPYHFVLDTGAGITVITPEFARRAGLSGSANQQVTGSGGSVQVRTVVLRDVRVGKADVRNVATAIVPLPLDLTYQGDYGTIDGVLGYSFLSHFAVTIDIEASTVTFSPPGVYETPPGATSVHADLTDDTPVVDAQADRITGAFKLDTGDSGDITLDAAFVVAHHFKARYRNGRTIMFEGVGGLQHGSDVRLHRFSLGGSTMPNTVATLSAATTGLFAGTTLAGNVGDDVLKRFVFTVDYLRHRVDFTPRRDVAAYQPDKGGTGLLSVRQADGTFRVIAILAHSPASAASLHVGDTLVAVNGDPFAHLDLAQIRETLLGGSVTYTVRSGGKERNVTLALRDLPIQGSGVAAQ